MVTFRKVTLVTVLVASLAVLAMAIYLFWDLGSGQPILDQHTGDIELLVGILLASCSLYAIVFALSSYSSAMSFARQADRSIAEIRDQLGAAVGELRALQDEARNALRARPQPQSADPATASPNLETHPNLEAHVDAIVRKIAKWNAAGLDSQAKLELLHYESAAAYLELIGAAHSAASLAGLYRRFAELYSASDKARQRFYLGRALSLALPDSRTASEIHYELACWFADNRDFSHALGELTLAFQHQSKALDDRLALDIDEGGRLCQLASTPPFEKALNDLLLNMSIGIG
jgi:hypothetical protein